MILNLQSRALILENISKLTILQEEEYNSSIKLKSKHAQVSLPTIQIEGPRISILSLAKQKQTTAQYNNVVLKLLAV